MRDYIVAVDENGQPYLAHAGEGGWKNRATKYLGKFPNLYGNGKTAYAYTQQQLRAMQNYARGGARNAQNSVINTAKNLDQTRRTLKSDLKKRATAKAAEKEAANPWKKISETREKHLLGDSVTTYSVPKTSAENVYAKKFAEATKKTYDKTKLGKAENAAKEAVTNAVAKAKDTAKEATGLAAKERRDAAKKNLSRADEAVAQAEDRANKYYDKVDAALMKDFDAIENESAAKRALDNSNIFNRNKNKKNYEEAVKERQETDKEFDNVLLDRRAQNEYLDALSAQRRVYGEYAENANAYDRSIAGRAEQAAKKATEVKETVRDAKEKVGDFLYDKKLDAEIAVDDAKEKLTGEKARKRAEKIRDEEKDLRARAAGVTNEYVKDYYNSQAETAAKMAKRYEDQADSTLVGRANNATSKIKSKSDRMKEEFRKKKEDVKDKLGVDEKERAEKAWAEVPKRVDSSDKDAVDKLHKAVKAQDEYRETPLGKAEYLTERAKEIATGQDGNAKEVAEKAAKAVKSKADKMKDEFRKKAEETKDKLGFDEKKRLDEAKDELDKTINLGRSDNVIPRTKSGAIDLEESGKQQDAARTNVDKRRDEYHETPIGKVSKAKDDAEEAVDKAKEKVSNTADKVSASIKETMDKIEREVDFATAPKAFRKMIKNNAKNKGISEEEAKQELIKWTEKYYTNMGDLERRDRYLEALKKA